MRKKVILILIIFNFILNLSGCNINISSKIEAPEAVGEFNFTILKAGKADAMILKTENHCVIIDCGEKDDGKKITEYLDDNNISIIDYIFITHFDKDHVGGFPKIAENIDIENIMVPDYEGNNTEYKNYIKAVEEKELSVTRLKTDVYFVLDDVSFEVSIPKKQAYEESDNDFSLVISVTHGENNFLFAGDAEQERISEILSEFSYEYDFLKVPHHGRYNSNTEKFVKVIMPKYSVICDSEKNPADEKTISALEAVGSEIYSTANGDVFVASDGKEIKCQYSNKM